MLAWKNIGINSFKKYFNEADVLRNVKWWQTSNLRENNLRREGGRDETEPRGAVVCVGGGGGGGGGGVQMGCGAVAVQSNGDICSSSSEELKRSYLHTKGFATE